MVASFRWWCCCGDYMDSGCYFPDPYAQTYPVNCYVDTKISDHLDTGDTVDGDTVVYLPGSETEQLLCNLKLTVPDGLTLYAEDVNSHYYPSPVQVNESVGESIQFSVGVLTEGNAPPYRWTGHSRLWAQARQGVGKNLDISDNRLLIHPDTEGLLISESFNFYLANLDGDTVTITPLRARSSECIIEGLRDGTIPDDEYHKALAHALARLEVDPDQSSYTTGDMSFANGKGCYGYGWHWNYVGNECSKCVIDNRELNTHGWALISLLRVDFSFNTDALGVESVTASLAIEDRESKFRVYTSDLLWVRSNQYGKEVLNPVTTNTGDGFGDVFYGENVPVYCFYKQDGSRAVLRYTFEDDDGIVTSADEFPANNEATCADSTYHEGRKTANERLRGGTWTLGDVEVTTRTWSGYVNWQEESWEWIIEPEQFARTFDIPSRDGQCSGTLTYVDDGRTPPDTKFNTLRQRARAQKELSVKVYVETGSATTVIQSSYNPDVLYIGQRNARDMIQESWSYVYGYHTNPWRYYGPDGAGTSYAYPSTGENYDYNYHTSGVNTDVDEPPWTDNDPPDVQEDVIQGVGAVFVSEQGEPDEVIKDLFSPYYAHIVGEFPAEMIAMESYNGVTRYNTTGPSEFGGNEVKYSGLHEDKLMRYCGWV